MPYTPRELREVFHFCFLERLLKISDPRFYALKGGVNLRFFFNSPRYSEDMDIDVLAGAVNTLKKNGYKILNDPSFKRSLKTYGIAEMLLNDPATAKQTQTTQRFRLRLVTNSGDSLPTKIEFSRRKETQDESLFELPHPEIARKYQKLGYRCQHYSGIAMVLQKIRALAGRSVTQARDAFDIYILHAGGFSAQLDLAGLLPKDLLQKAKDNLNLLSYVDFSGHVLEFLEDAERAQFDGPKNWQNIKNEVTRILSHEN